MFRQKYALTQRIWNHEHCLSIIRGRRCNHQKTLCTCTERPRKPKNKENYKQQARTLLAGPGKAGCNADLMSDIFHVEISPFCLKCQVRTTRLQVKQSYHFNGPRNIFLALYWVVSRGNAIYFNVSCLFSIYFKISTHLFLSLPHHLFNLRFPTSLNCIVF